MVFNLKLKRHNKWEKAPSSVYVTEDASKKYSSEREFVVKEAGFTGHIHKAKDAVSALKKHNSKHGYYGGAVSVSLNR